MFLLEIEFSNLKKAIFEDLIRFVSFSFEQREKYILKIEEASCYLMWIIIQ